MLLEETWGSCLEVFVIYQLLKIGDEVEGSFFSPPFFMFSKLIEFSRSPPPSFITDIIMKLNVISNVVIQKIMM